MAKTTTVHVTDDMNGDPDAQTYSFSWANQDYEIHLVDRSLVKLEKALAPFIEKATRVSGRRAAGGKTSKGGARSDLAEARAWLQSEGHPVADRGRIGAELLALYDDAR
ncbi:histone-like nucleoid-structuring protein Lsr2 [Nocardioides plantarum]|uniref:Lsr2 family protein n=1 Tax=Nocardioides plantarum TaxID=29299 RepID=A0ABV5KCA6_9ACTN|nr:Lsr2 family protein [Nocardioides plantarum]